MKPGYVTPRFRFLLAVLVLLLQGCQKVFDYLHEPGHGNADSKICTINKLTISYSTSESNYVVHYNLVYNNCGDPVSVTNDQITTGNPNMQFKYDKYNRLREMIRPYENGAYETLNRYGYNNKNQIVRDTLYVFGAVNDPVATAFESFYGTIDYDAQNRVAAQTDSIFFQGHFNGISRRTYSYDERGNLITGVTDLAYDNKISILRTNKVWMFISRNYSVNNPVGPTQYNEFGLPVRLPAEHECMGLIAPGFPGGQVLAEYNCHQ